MPLLLHCYHSDPSFLPGQKQEPANRSVREKEWSRVSSREFAKMWDKEREPLLKFLLTQGILAHLGFICLLISNKSANTYSLSDELHGSRMFGRWNRPVI